MKRTYISPEALSLPVRPASVLMGSVPEANIDQSDAARVAPGSFETKGNSHVNIWGNEW